MIKKLKATLKKILGGRKEIHKESPITTTSEDKKTLPAKPKFYQNKERYTQRNPNQKSRKKETPEEYRQRRQKRFQDKTIDEKSLKSAIPKSWDVSEYSVPLADGKIRFHDLDVSNEILHAVYDLKFEYCTPVQAEVLPKALSGNDITAQAQTGTGKTAAFLLTIFNHVLKYPIKTKRRPGTPRALILAPTRELVLQIEKDARALGKYLNLSILSLLGGMDYRKQENILRKEPGDLLICTPGRLIDFMQKNLVDLKHVEILVIDEADRMLDMGFIPDVKKIVVKTPPKEKRQTMFFSATLTGDVKRLAESWTRDASQIIIKPESVAVQSVEQITYITTIEEKPTLLYNLIMQKNLERVIVFVNRKIDAKRLKEKFEAYGVSCTLLSGDIEQSQRIKRLEKFREGKVRVLVATDVASRGIHVESVSHVINFNLPQDAEEYVHRIGRTGRAGASGISISFADEDDSHEIEKLEDFLGKKIELKYPEDELLVPIPEKHRNVEHKKPFRKTSSIQKSYNAPNRKKH